MYAEWLGAPGKPTLLFYGHYDVQPPDPLDEWKSPPFEPAIRNDNIYARGSADDKGQTYILIKAVEGLLKQHGRLPINVKFLVEGEEEVGGEHIESYVRSKPARIKADAAVICDTEMFAPELPTICVGLRGIVYGELWVQGADHDLHSGIYGGAAPNPIQAIAEILCALKDAQGHIQIPGFYDRVQAPSEKERAAWARLPFNEKEYTEKEMGAKELVGEPGDSGAGTHLGAAYARSARHSRRLHRRRREDRDSSSSGCQNQHASGGRSTSRGSHRAASESHRRGVSQGRHRRIQANPLRSGRRW